MGPDRPLPISDEFASTEQYVHNLIEFVTTSPTLTTLCGGVHVLDFFTTAPDLYTTVIPETWRAFFSTLDIMDLLDLLMRDDLDHAQQNGYRDSGVPPADLVDYIRTVRRLSLKRRFEPTDGAMTPKLAREVALGMTVKKVHEVGHFSRFIHDLSDTISADRPSHKITHLIDLGSGQGYLPRALAMAPYHHASVGVESRQNNIEGSKNWDVMAKLAPKPKVLRDKKTFRAERDAAKSNGTAEIKTDPSVRGERGFFHHPGAPEVDTDPDAEDVHISSVGRGSIQYISHYLLDGDLNRVTAQIVEPSAVSAMASSDSPLSQSEANALPRASAASVNALVLSLHSCGNLVHHGLRSLLLTPSVRAVALVGCCYNLLTERLGPPTYKHPGLRTPNPRMENLSAARDPHGFPMSQRLCQYTPKDGPDGVRLNITARMMAVQAPQNWSRADSAGFFTRHFFRALLQRVFLDLGLIPAPGPSAEEREMTSPVILGSLPAKAYKDFTSYVRAAAKKLGRSQEGVLHPSMTRGAEFAKALDDLSDEDIADYERRYLPRRAELAAVWSLMAFSAGAVESLIIVDRWLWLKEQEEVQEAWVQSAFDFAVSPRNMVIVGVKKEGV